MKRPAVIDIEASGFGAGSYPVEVGFALSDGDRFCTLITPPDEWTHWTEEAQSVHGLPRDILFTHGIPVREVAQALNARLAGQTLFSDGWVVDQPWLTTLFAAAGMAQQFTVSPLELILNEAQMAIWAETRDEVVKALDLSRHRASSDAEIIQETWVRTRKATGG
ncbi:MAG: hypothetical protein HKO62_06085 [Gammaproteobacteria bacterium]|nr:hypothetical protein [Gammaproteobacteria bacterium]